MNTLELYNKISEFLPIDLRCEWDNDGIMVLPSDKHETRKILLCLDITSDVLERAIKEGANCIISHHPLVFKGLKSVGYGSFESTICAEFIKHDIAVLSFHTRLDAGIGGINDKLCEILGLKDITVFECGGEKICRRGKLCSPLSFEEFLSLVTRTLGARGIGYVKGFDTVSDVILAGGSYDEGIAYAQKAGADVFLSGELKYHNMLSAKENGFSVISAGHYFTEKIAVDCFCDILSKIDNFEFIKHYGTSPISYTEA